MSNYSTDHVHENNPADQQGVDVDHTDDPLVMLGAADPDTGDTVDGAVVVKPGDNAAEKVAEAAGHKLGDNPVDAAQNAADKEAADKASAGDSKADQSKPTGTGTKATS